MFGWFKNLFKEKKQYESISDLEKAALVDDDQDAMERYRSYLFKSEKRKRGWDYYLHANHDLYTKPFERNRLALSEMDRQEALTGKREFVGENAEAVLSKSYGDKKEAESALSTTEKTLNKPFDRAKRRGDYQGSDQQYGDDAINSAVDQIITQNRIYRRR